MGSNVSMVENVLQTGLVNDIQSSCRHHVVSLCEVFKVEGDGESQISVWGCENIL